jgi:HEAT repeat protein
MKRRHYVTIAGLLLCITLWWILQPDNHNPTYKGKRLSVWLQGYDSGDQHERAITDEVVRQIGTNAVSFLLHELGVNDSALKTKLVHLASRQRIIKLPYTHPAVRRERADSALKALRPQAKNVAPVLVHVYESSTDGSSKTKLLVIGLLGSMGPDAKMATPLLLHETANTDARIRQQAIWALGQIRAAPESVVPALIHALRDSDVRVAASAARGLANYGRAAQEAVPVLQQLVKEEEQKPIVDRNSVPHRELHIAASDAVSWIKDASSPETVVPGLIAALDDADLRVRESAALRLRRFGPEAKAAVPRLLELLEQENRLLKETPDSLSHRAMHGALTAALTAVTAEKSPAR